MGLIGKKVEFTDNYHGKKMIGIVLEKTYRGYKEIKTEFMIELENGKIKIGISPSSIHKIIKSKSTWEN